jgi:hypothetical protein
MRRRILIATEQAGGPNFMDREGNYFILADGQIFNVRE